VGDRWAYSQQEVVELLAPLKLEVDKRAAFFDKLDRLRKHDAIHPGARIEWQVNDNVQVYNKKKEEWFSDGIIKIVGDGAKAGKFHIEYDGGKKKKWAAWKSMRPPLVEVPSTKKRKQMDAGKRCYRCEKKLKTHQSWQCKCIENDKPNARFCTGCRYPTSHECTYDKQQAHKDMLIKKNPLIKPAKFQKLSPSKPDERK